MENETMESKRKRNDRKHNFLGFDAHKIQRQKRE